MMNMQLSKDNSLDFASWVGRSTKSIGGISVQMASMISATFGDARTAALRDGDVIPAMWHWYGFPPDTPTQDLGPDGHPHKGGFLPPIPLDRRMWAGGKLRFHQPLRVGEPLERRSRIAKVVQKDGSAGPMVFVTVDHEICGADGLAVEERQDIVYLAIPKTFSPPPKKPGPTDGIVVDRQIEMTVPLLFRYSAITFNGHRIHYDLEYVTEVEHYPGLVVHGPMQANLLLAEATAYRNKTPTVFEFRGVHPMFHGQAMTLRATQGEDGALALCTMAPEGHMCMQATAIWEE